MEALELLLLKRTEEVVRAAHAKGIAVDAESDLVWGVGFAMADATLKAAKDNPNTQFAIIDNGNDSQVSNFTGVMFRAQEPSFVVGYIAARTTKTGKVGFVGGISSALIDQFEYGYRGGVRAAARPRLKKRHDFHRRHGLVGVGEFKNLGVYPVYLQENRRS